MVLQSNVGSGRKKTKQTKNAHLSEKGILAFSKGDRKFGFSAEGRTRAVSARAQRGSSSPELNPGLEAKSRKEKKQRRRKLVVNPFTAELRRSARFCSEGF